MSGSEQGVGDVLIGLHAIARKLEGEGQYNVAKLARAAADSLARSSAFPIQISSHKDELAAEVLGIAKKLRKYDLDERLLDSLVIGATAIGEGLLTMLDETPHPFVCRTCGYVVLSRPSSDCPRCHSQPRTFQRFPPVYWLETMDPMEAMVWLERTPEHVKRLLDGISEEEMAQEIITGEWSFREVLTHLRDAQGVLDFRVNLLIDEDTPVIESKAVFEWAKDGSESQVSALEIFHTYYDSRQGTLDTLRGIPLKDWWREGRHEEFGTINIKQQASYFATHELTHLPQFNSLKKQLGS